MTITMWLILVVAGFLTFFYSYLNLDDEKAAVMYIFSTVFFMLSGANSFYLETVTSSGEIVSYSGNQLMGLILIPLSLVSAAFALSALTQKSVDMAEV